MKTSKNTSVLHHLPCFVCATYVLWFDPSSVTFVSSVRCIFLQQYRTCMDIGNSKIYLGICLYQSKGSSIAVPWFAARNSTVGAQRSNSLLLLFLQVKRLGIWCSCVVHTDALLQCIRVSWWTRKLFIFIIGKKHFLDRSIPKICNLILKTEALFAPPVLILNNDSLSIGYGVVMS